MASHLWISGLPWRERFEVRTSCGVNVLEFRLGYGAGALRLRKSYGVSLWNSSVHGVVTVETRACIGVSMW